MNYDPNVQCCTKTFIEFRLKSLFILNFLFVLKLNKYNKA